MVMHGWTGQAATAVTVDDPLLMYRMCSSSSFCARAAAECICMYGIWPL